MLESGLGTLVTYNPTAVSAETPVDEVLRRMDHFAIRHLPVIDEERRVIGVVSELDLIGALDPKRIRDVGSHGSTTAADTWFGPDSPVSQVMTGSVLTIDQKDSPQAALQLMMQRGFHSIPVVDDGRLVGITTSTDFLREFSYGEFPACNDLVSQHMAGWHVQVGAGATREEALRLMEDEGIEYLAVVAGELPIGIVSRRSLSGEGRDTASRGHRDAGDRGGLPVIDAPVLRGSDTLAQAAHQMVEAVAKAANVVHRSSRLIGLLTEDHILNVMASQLV